MSKLQLMKSTVKNTTVATFLGLVPGALLLAGVYLLTKKIRRDYKLYKEENPDATFKPWFKEEAYPRMLGSAKSNYEILRARIKR